MIHQSLILLFFLCALVVGDENLKQEKAYDWKQETGQHPDDEHSLQRYLINRILSEDIDLTCCVKPNQQVRAITDFVNHIIEECCKSSNSDLRKLANCSQFAVLNTIGSTCVCINKQQLRTRLSHYILQASKDDELLYSISKPIDTDNPDNFLNEFAPAALSCNDKRLQGVLCSFRDKSYVTAGNTLCRSNDYCHDHGYSYSWCYVDFSNHWEYCCTGKCDFLGETYRWCESGDTWEHCGFYPKHDGLRAVNNKACTLEYPCGKHGGGDSYWCYYDANKNWDYCCAPNESCEMDGEKYLWCYTADSGADWDYCEKNTSSRHFDSDL